MPPSKILPFITVAGLLLAFVPAAVADGVQEFRDFLTVEELVAFNAQARLTLHDETDHGSATYGEGVLPSAILSRLFDEIQELEAHDPTSLSSSSTRSMIPIKHMTTTTQPHADRFVMRPDQSIVEDSVAFIMLNTNKDAKFVHGGEEVPIQARTLVSFQGSTTHHTVVNNGHVKIAGPFHVASMESVGDPTSTETQTTLVFPSPCASLPAGRTPHDDNTTNDDGWTLVDFCVTDGTNPPPGCHHNDDESATVNLPFPFVFYGQTFTKAFINNNGNLSFNNSFFDFTAEGFPTEDFAMIAPFWADVDTGARDNEIGHVWIKSPSPNVFAVAWDTVGYYDEVAVKRNSFQVIISDGLDDEMGIGNNACFCYDQMDWTTGDVDGVDGFGAPATVGANKGNGEDFFQIGLFGVDGDAYDGPSGNVDGVNYLEGKSFCFTTSDITNIPPIASQFPTSDVTLECGEPLELQLLFLSPEDAQTTNVVVENVPPLMEVTNTPGNTAEVNLQWTTATEGTYTLTFIATDNFSTPGETVKTLNIIVACTTTTSTSTTSTSESTSSTSGTTETVTTTTTTSDAVTTEPEATTTASIPKEKPQCNPTFCQVCFSYCGVPPYDVCDDSTGVPSVCKIDPLCEVCEVVCPAEANSNEDCPVGCLSGDLECPSDDITPTRRLKKEGSTAA